MNKKYKEYLNSKEWADIKIDLYAVRGRRCERCGNGRFLQVHHKHYRNIFKEEPADLEILCSICHKKEHGIGEKKKTLVRPQVQHKRKKKKHSALRGANNRKSARKNKRDKKKAWRDKMLNLCINDKEKSFIRGFVVSKAMTARLKGEGVVDSNGRLKDRSIFKLKKIGT